MHEYVHVYLCMHCMHACMCIYLSFFNVSMPFAFMCVRIKIKKNIHTFGNNTVFNQHTDIHIIRILLLIHTKVFLKMLTQTASNPSEIAKSSRHKGQQRLLALALLPNRDKESSQFRPPIHPPIHAL